MSLHLAAAALAITLAGLAWKRRTASSAANSLAALCAALAVWCAAYAAEIATPALDGKLGWERVEYLGIAVFPTLFLIFAIQLSGRGEWLGRAWLGPLLCVAPLVAAVGAWTNDSHRLFYVESRLVTERGAVLLEQRHGPLFEAHAAYSYFLIVAAVALLFARVRHSSPHDRGRALLVALGGAVPLVGNALHLGGLAPLDALDPTPLLLAVALAAGLAGSWRTSFIEIVPAGSPAIVERMSEGVMVVDLYGRLAELNAAAARILGGSRSDLLQRDAGEALALFPEAQARIRAGSGATEGVVVHGGDGRSYDVSLDGIRDHLGRRTSLLLLWRDATTRVAAERALLEETDLTQQLARQQTILFQVLREAGGTLDPAEVAQRAVRTVSSLTPWKNVAVALAEGDGYRVLAASGELEAPSDRRFEGGITARAIRTGAIQRVADVAADPDYVRGGVATRSEMAVPIARRGVVVGVLSVESEKPAAFSDGDVRMLESIAGAVALGLDNARLFSALAERNRELEELAKLREHLMNTLVHDLRNPAFAVVGLAELLEGQSPGLDEEGREELRLIRESGDRILSLASAILEIARLESRTLRIDPAACDLAALAGGVVGRQRAAASRRGLDLCLAAEPALPPARVDHRLVERVVENLLGNAVKFSPDGGRVLVRLSVDPETSGFLRLEVSDQGLGVSEKMRPRLFEKFARGDEAVAGTGLGLAFCRLAVEANGGRIWLADEGSEPGATFALRLPAA